MCKVRVEDAQLYNENFIEMTAYSINETKSLVKMTFLFYSDDTLLSHSSCIKFLNNYQMLFHGIWHTQLIIVVIP